MKKIKSLSEQVCDYIIRKIKLGELSAGEKVSESDLIEQLQISRTPIREAFIQLAADNVLDNIPRKGFFVKTFDREEVAMNYRIVARLDAYAAELAVPNIDEQALREMDASIQRMDLAVEQQNYEIYNTEQELFHDIYLDKCGNSQLIDLIHSLLKKYVRTTGYSEDKDKLFHFLASANEDHHSIIRFFRKKNIEELTQVLIKHWQMVYTANDKDFY